MENGEDAAGVKSQREKEREATRVALRQVSFSLPLPHSFSCAHSFDVVSDIVPASR